MYYPAEKIDLKPGLQRLNGEDALGYVRYRHDALGDITRAERQQKFLTALAKEMFRARTIIKLPKLIPQLMDAVETNLKMTDVLFLARVTSKLNPDNIVTATLPGTFYNYKGVSYWKADEDKAKVVFNDLFRGLKLATITGPDINVPPDKKAAKKPQAEPEESTSEEPPQEDNSLPPQGTTGESDQNNNGTPDSGLTDSTGGSSSGQNTTTPVSPPDAASPQPGGTSLPSSGSPGSNTTTSPPAPGGPAQGPATVPQGSGQATGNVTTPKVDIIQQG